MKTLDVLSQREKQVTDLLMQGMSNKQIALTLGIAERTVEFHLNNIYAKLMVGSRMELALHLWKATGESNSGQVESTVASTEENPHNDSQPDAKARWAKTLKSTVSLIKKETVMTIKIILEDLGSYFRKRPLLTGALTVLVASFAVYLLIFEYGLYFPISYLLLGLSLGLGSLYLGLSWNRIKNGKYKVRFAVVLTIILIPLFIMAVDSILLYTVGRNMAEVQVNLPGLSNRAAWLVSTSGDPFLSRHRSTTNDELWLIGFFLYIFLLAMAGNFAGRLRTKRQNPSPA